MSRGSSPRSLVDRKKDSGQLQVSHAVSLSQDGLFGKACNVLVSCGIAPNSDETWNLLVSKHPKSDCPSVPGLPQNDVSLPSSLNLMAILRSFPKLSAAGPSGLRIQHLIDAAEITLQTPILHLLRKVINILASGKAPVDVSIFLAGGNLTALQKSKPGCPLDVRPIAVGEALRRLVGKCLCSMLKSKAAEFFYPLQRGVACAAGAEKIAHGLRGCMDENWQAEGFTVLKIDLVNAFNLKWWLGLDTAEGSICALCPDKMLDPLGHHATTCKRGGDVVFRHNKLRDILAETCRRAHLSVQVEAGCNLTPDHSHSRPADVLISNWVLGKTAACDISVTSPLNSNIMSEAGVTAGAAAQATELRKHEANDVKCSELGWLCIPLVVESYGAWGKEAMESFSSLASRLAITSSRPKSAVLSELYGRLNLNLVRANVRAIMSRYCPLNSF
eukprot:Em0014g921a